ncbi:MAG: hypothetical protein GX902_09320 [Lentisphaerae bacterium]|nr:hypothetical protein [Lentisphaerota bacterium]
MSKTKILSLLIVTGPGGDAQGWGDLSVTETLCASLREAGYAVQLAFVRTPEEFIAALRTNPADLVWSCLYYFTEKEDIIGIDPAAVWVSDLLEERGMPYIGPSAQTMKNLILKYTTHCLMRKRGVAVPEHHLINIGEDIPELPLPAFVKPNGESRSIGISDASVVNTRAELCQQVARMHRELQQPALVEDYLPGEEYTVLMLGNGPRQEILPGKVSVDESCYGRYRILRSDLRGVGKTRISIPEDPARFAEAVALSRQATEALDCLDHVRLDLRVDAQGKLRVIEINGIPGLKPVKSWSPQIYSLYHPVPGGPMLEYRHLLEKIVCSARERWQL